MFYGGPTFDLTVNRHRAHLTLTFSRQANTVAVLPVCLERAASGGYLLFKGPCRRVPLLLKEKEEKDMDNFKKCLRLHLPTASQKWNHATFTCKLHWTFHCTCMCFRTVSQNSKPSCGTKKREITNNKNLSFCGSCVYI